MFGESCCRGTQLLAFRTAAIETWGELGWSDACARLDPETRDVVDRTVAPVAWVPERCMLSLADAIFEGPAARSNDVYRQFVRHQVDFGFGRVRRALLYLAPPERILERAPALWRHDHTHGELVVDEIREGFARVRLVDHEHPTSDVACMTAAEIFRYVLSLTRAKGVTSTFRRLAPRTLQVDLAWGAR